MAKDDDGFPVGNQDPTRRGRDLPRPDRESSNDRDSRDSSQRPARGEKPGYGEVTDDRK